MGIGLETDVRHQGAVPFCVDCAGGRVASPFTSVLTRHPSRSVMMMPRWFSTSPPARFNLLAKLAGKVSFPNGTRVYPKIGLSEDQQVLIESVSMDIGPAYIHWNLAHETVKVLRSTKLVIAVLNIMVK